MVCARISANGVGRIRADISNENAIDLFVSGDQILKGAALNGIQIAERWMRMGVEC